MLVVSHSMEDISKISSKVLVMNESHLAYYDTVDGVFSHADSLKKMGLNIPQLTELFLKLKAKGYDVSTDVYTMEKAERELLKLLKGGDKNAR